MSDFIKDYHHRRLINSIRDYYLSNFPNKTKDDWEKILRHDVRSFNLVWRAALRQRFPEIELNDEPPPVYYRSIYDFTSRESGRVRDQLEISGED